MNRILPGVLAMAILVVASNILVQHLYGKWLTYGAFTYPLTFLVNDLTNRLQGSRAARQVVVSGFIVGIICSLIGSQIQGEFGPLVTFRVALGSGLAFLNGQLLDIFVFNRYRNSAGWWKAPFFSALIGSTLDSIIFFTIASVISLYIRVRAAIPLTSPSFCSLCVLLTPGRTTRITFARRLFAVLVRAISTPSRSSATKGTASQSSRRMAR